MTLVSEDATKGINASNLSLYNAGVIDIDISSIDTQNYVDGIMCKDFTNLGNISVKAYSETTDPSYGIFASGSLSNNGNIAVNLTAKNGTACALFNSNSSTFTNEGNISLSVDEGEKARENTSIYGIHFPNGNFDNSGSITVTGGDCTSNCYGIYTKNFKNAGSESSVKMTMGTSMQSSTIPFLVSNVTNEGCINITSATLDGKGFTGFSMNNSSTFTNSGSVCINYTAVASDTSKLGSGLCYAIRNGDLTNDGSLVFNMDVSQSDYSGGIIIYSDEITNSGELEINYSPNCKIGSCISSKTFDNSGSLSVITGDTNIAFSCTTFKTSSEDATAYVTANGYPFSLTNTAITDDGIDILSLGSTSVNADLDELDETGFCSVVGYVYTVGGNVAKTVYLGSDLSIAKTLAIRDIEEVRDDYVSDEAKAILDDAIAAIKEATSVDEPATIAEEAISDADDADLALTDEIDTKTKELTAKREDFISDEAKAAIDQAIENIKVAASINAVDTAASNGIKAAEDADKALADAIDNAVTELTEKKSTYTVDEAVAAIEQGIEDVKKGTTSDAIKDIVDAAIKAADEAEANKPTPSPSPDPTPSGNPTPSPSPEPTPSGNPTPSPTPSSKPTEEPTPTVPPTTPEPTPTPELDVGAFINRCYEVALGREADKEGYEYWVSNLNNGQACGAQVGFGFIFSEEYTNKNRTNEEFVNDMYAMYFGREADEAGFNYWVEQLNNETATREDIMAGFANSEEFFNLCGKYGVVCGAYIVGVPNDQQGGVNCFVARLYKVCLNRLPDMGGQAGWVQKLLNGEVTGTTCAYGFVFSPEFVNLNLDNTNFVKYMYNAFFGREADAEGLNYWVEQLDAGTASREDVFAGFSGSAEFANLCSNYGIIA
ncbi:MAG: DUF4214 domain-containing protein [Clostridia bacterium]|nr:DUF4214 domain-containing protein [Clostridia bacterium]